LPIATVSASSTTVIFQLETDTEAATYQPCIWFSHDSQSLYYF